MGLWPPDHKVGLSQGTSPAGLLPFWPRELHLPESGQGHVTHSGHIVGAEVTEPLPLLTHSNFLLCSLLFLGKLEALD